MVIDKSKTVWDEAETVVKNGPPRTRVTRVLKGEKGIRQVAQFGFVVGSVPEDGYLIATGSLTTTCIFIRDSDLAAAAQERKTGAPPFTVEAKSWDC